MVVLGKEDIEHSIGFGDLDVISQESPSIEPASMDVHLSKRVKYPEKENNETVKVDQKETYPDYYSIESPRPTVSSGEFALGTTVEDITIPRGMVALLHGRSSVGRLGLFIENAGLIDPGFGGQVTLELANVADYDIELVSGMRIGQLTFHRVDTAPEVGYSKQNGNKYNGQQGPTASRLWEDFE